MDCRRLKQCLMRLAPAIIAIAMMAGPSFGLEVNLVADTVNKTMPDGTTITMWGFGYTSETVSVPGPMLEVPDGDTSLTVNLINNLPEGVSIVIPGQIAALNPQAFADAQGRTRVYAFTTETAGGGGENTYTWNNLKPGTYIYHSGSHPALQVQMGLYGGVTVGAYPGIAPGVDYQNEVVLFYSEIDPELHAAPAAANPTNYKPDYFLVNGKPYEAGDEIPAAQAVGDGVLIRFLNAGFKTHVPTLLNSYMDVIAEDGNLYPHSKKQYSVILPAMKTKDAIWRSGTEGTYPVFDASHYLTTAGIGGGGLVAKLIVGAAGAPVAADDSITVPLGGTTTTLNGGSLSVLENDLPATGLTAHVHTFPQYGDLTLNTDGTFVYTHTGADTTSDSFTYYANDGTVDSDPATVTITVTPNDAPVAADDSFTATEGQTLSVSAPGVLGNDTDPDGDILTAALVTGPAGGTLSLDTNGAFDYTPNQDTTSDSFTYTASDGTVASAPATVTITVGTAANQPPVATDDYANTDRNVAVFVNMAANDSDPDGNLKDGFGDVSAGQFTIVTPPTRGGTVDVLTNGVNFTPKKNFQGTDVFTYTVTDLDGAASNEATVRVNVIR